MPLQADKCLTFITGPAHSGKSRHACRSANPKLDTLFVGTASPKHPHMQARISELKAERPAGWQVIERPQDLAELIRNAAAIHEQIVIDSLNLWLASVAVNAPSHGPQEEILIKLREESDRLCRSLSDARHAGANLIIVGAETGAAPSPPVETERAYREANGILNQSVAAAAERVILLTAGVPLTIVPASNCF